jgi:hypothetical protein
MPQQLIYTSAPQGLAAGRSGHCTVARSAAMREPLVLRLEQLSYYQHLSLSGGKERPIFAYRVIDIRGARFHVLSRIQDAGLDFTGRTNFIAHHLVLAAEDFRQFPIPPIILRDWPGWVKSWTREPTLLDSEDWSGLASLGNKSSVPARTWQRVTGDSANGYGLLEARAGATFRVDDQTNETVLGLFAESIELLEVRDARRDFRTAALQYTFTTSMQEQDNPSDFRWRCIHFDNPAANRLAAPDCRALSAVRAAKWTAEEAAFANDGRNAPKFLIEPQDVQIIEGQEARFQAKAEGIPHPTYQWYSVDRTDNGQPLTDATNPELALSNSTLGKFRYVVRVSNSAGDAVSRTATLSVEQKPRLAQANLASQGRPFAPGHQKTESDIERQRKQLQSEEAENRFRRKQRLKRSISIAVLIVTTFIVALVCFIFVNPKYHSTLEKLAGKLPFLRVHTLSDLTNQSPSTNQSLTIAQGDISPVHIMGTNKDDSSTNVQRELAATNSNEGRGMEWGLPPGWTNAAIGIVPIKRAEFPTTNRFDLEAVASGFASNSDNVFFTYSTNDEGEFRVQLKKWPPTDSTVGIMMRQSLDSNSPFLFIGTSSNHIVSYSRDTERKYRDRTTNSRAEKLPLSLWFNVGANGDVTARWESGVAKPGWKLRFSQNKPLIGFAVLGSTNGGTAQFFYAPTPTMAIKTK